MTGVLDLTGLALIERVRLRLDVKIKKDSGSEFHDHIADPTGTTVTFNRTFIDIRSILVTAALGAGSTPITAVYDFVDVPNPTEFKVLLFRTSDGVAVSGNFSWQVEGF